MEITSNYQKQQDCYKYSAPISAKHLKGINFKTIHQRLQKPDRFEQGPEIPENHSFLDAMIYLLRSSSLNRFEVTNVPEEN